MDLKWTSKALSDLARLYRACTNSWLQRTSRQPHGRVHTLTRASTMLLTNPRIGEQLFEFEPREVRRLLVGHYEMRYEIQESIIYLLRLWHTREDR